MLTEMQLHMLDLLVDGESSFAALLHALRRHWGHEDLQVLDMIDEAVALEIHQVIRLHQMRPDGSFHAATESDIERARLEYSLAPPGTTAGDVAVDEIGLWMEITDAGREALSAWGDSRTPEGRWTLTDRAVHRRLEIRADVLATAREALRKWVDERDDVEIIRGTESVSPALPFTSKDGVTVENGIILECRYRVRSP